MPHQLRAVPLSVLNPLAIAAALALAGTARAQESPYYIGASAGYTRDSNVFRAPAGQEIADSIASAGVLGGLKLELGRQQVFADVTAQSNHHRNVSQLNNTSYSANGGINWQTVEHLSGSVRLVARQNLGDYGAIGSPQVKNVETTHQATASVRYGFTSQLGLEGGLEHGSLKYSFTSERDVSQDVASLGFRWGEQGSLLTLGVGARGTKGESPHYKALVNPLLPVLGFGPETPDKFDRKDIDFTAVWTPSALSALTGRVSLTRENHSIDARPDFSGATGSLQWDYKPTGKLAFKTSLTRDTGTQTAFVAVPLLEPLQTTSNRLNTLLSVDVDYELTAKIALTGGLRHTNGTVVDSLGNSLGETTKRYAVGGRYSPTRTITLGCNVARETRSTYNATTTGCTGQLVLR